MWLFQKAFFLIAIAAFVGCQRDNPKELERLFRIAEDRQTTYKERTQAVESLRKVASKQAVDHLVLLLPGNYDAITLQVISALAEIGDPRALPKLLEMRDNRAEVEMPGKFWVALDHAIQQLENGAKADGKK